MRHFLPLLASAAICLPSIVTALAEPQGPASLVDPMIGTGGHGHVFPGATAPFGMVQVSPDTGTQGWDRCSGYHYDDKGILGFSHTHLSGTGCGDLGNILFLPMIGDIQWEPVPSGDDGGGLRPDTGLRVRFSHENEHAEAGYYRVKLSGSNILVELTATERSAVHRYTFPNSGSAHVFIDLKHKLHGPSDPSFDGELKIENPRTITGWQKTDGWSNPKTFYFVAEFSDPIIGQQFKNNGQDAAGQAITGANVQGAFEFKVSGGQPLVIKVGISPISVEGAKKNLREEVGAKGFDEVRAGTVQKWNDMLGRIRVASDDKAELRTFYTALYHTMVTPNLYNDADGRFVGPDRQVHPNPGFNYYSTFSLWDTFRAANPLYTLIAPDYARAFVDSMLLHFELTSFKQLPVWTLCGNDTWCMIGYHSVPVIVDAWFKGLVDYDKKKILTAMKESSNRREWNQEYRELGYAPSGEDPGQGTSRTLEYAFDDWCIARFAEAIGEKKDAEEYYKRSQNFRNVFDPAVGLMRGKTKDGSWVEPWQPTVVDFGSFTEGNAWQYSWSVMHDVPALIELMGGSKAFADKLDEMWTIEGVESHAPDVTGLIGQYAHGNEPSHHVAYLYNFVAQPWKTQKWVRRLMKEMYADKPDGICGNEDCGQMSAWLIFSALGFYPVNPASGVYLIGSPLFEKAGIKVKEKPLIILADNNRPENVYIQSATLNGQPLTRAWLTQKELEAGGTLRFVMGSQPNKRWGISEPPPATGY